MEATTEENEAELCLMDCFEIALNTDAVVFTRNGKDRLCIPPFVERAWRITQITDSELCVDFFGLLFTTMDFLLRKLKKFPQFREDIEDAFRFSKESSEAALKELERLMVTDNLGGDPMILVAKMEEVIEELWPTGKIKVSKDEPFGAMLIAPQAMLSDFFRLVGEMSQAIAQLGVVLECTGWTPREPAEETEPEEDAEPAEEAFHFDSPPDYKTGIRMLLEGMVSKTMIPYDFEFPLFFMNAVKVIRDIRKRGISGEKCLSLLVRMMSAMEYCRHSVQNMDINRAYASHCTEKIDVVHVADCKRQLRWLILKSSGTANYYLSELRVAVDESNMDECFLELLATMQVKIIYLQNIMGLLLKESMTIN